MPATLHHLAPVTELPPEPTPEQSAPGGEWVTFWDFVRASGVPTARARALLMSGEPWQGVTLAVDDSTAYPLVRLDSLPPAIKGRVLEVRAAKPDPRQRTARDPATRDPAAKTRDRLAAWRLGIIRPALAHPKGSPERAHALELLAGAVHTKTDGTPKRIGLSTLRAWTRDYEAGGLAALSTKPRKDAGTGRVLISRRWDGGTAGLIADLDRESIALEWQRYVRSLWASGAQGWREVADFSSTRLAELTAAQAPELRPEDIAALCDVENAAGLRRRVEQERAFAVVAVQAKDAKRFADIHVPRIRRTRAGLAPLDIVVGDVSPIDVLIQRPDGSGTATFRAICWLDLATNRLWVSLFLPPKGRAVTRVEVAASFASMASQWGLPRRLYLDNGSEYSWAEMLSAFSELSRLTGRAAVALVSDADSDTAAVIDEARSLILRAKPYNAPAKPIEGIFSALAPIVAMLPGYIGGDRMAKKSANIGIAPEPYPGTPSDFLGSFEVALNRYHNKKQSGALSGRSPREVYQGFVDAGWKATGVAESTLLLAFADEDRRQVRQGHIRWTTPRGETLYYTHPALWAWPDPARPVQVRVARHDPRFAFCFDGRALLCVATPDQSYGFTDRAGAREQGERQGRLLRMVSEMRRNCDRLDLIAELARSNAHLPAMPDTPFGAEITPSPEVARMVAALEDHTRATLESAAPIAPGLDQWSEPTTGSDPLLDALDWDE